MCSCGSFGLAAAILTKDIKTAFNTAHALKAGTVRLLQPVCVVLKFTSCSACVADLGQHVPSLR